MMRDALRDLETQVSEIAGGFRDIAALNDGTEKVLKLLKTLPPAEAKAYLDDLRRIIGSLEMAEMDLGRHIDTLKGKS